MTQEKLHHLFGGSTSKMWKNCWGWASLVSTLPHEEAGEAADLGTALHTGLLERKMQGEVDVLTIGRTDKLHYRDIPNWPEAEGPAMAVEFWNDVFNKALEGFITGKQILIEKKLMLFPDKDAGGTADIVILYYNDKGKLVGTVGDLKTGFHRVEPTEEQLLFYLAALYLRVKEKGKEIEEFHSFVWQPTHEEKYTTAKFTKKQVLSAVTAYEKAIAESYKEKPKFKVGSWCTWCKAKAVCKQYSKHIEKRMELATVNNKLPTVEHLSDEVLLQLFTHADDIESYLSEVRKWIIKRAQSGNPVAGTKLVEGVSRRTWKDELLAEQALTEAGINPMTQKLLGITAIEGMLKNLHQKEKVAEIMYPLTVRNPPPPKVTLTSDPRPAVKLTAPGSQLADADWEDKSMNATF